MVGTLAAASDRPTSSQKKCLLLSISSTTSTYLKYLLAAAAPSAASSSFHRTRLHIRTKAMASVLVWGAGIGAAAFLVRFLTVSARSPSCRVRRCCLGIDTSSLSLSPSLSHTC